MKKQNDRKTEQDKDNMDWKENYFNYLKTLQYLKNVNGNLMIAIVDTVKRSKDVMKSQKIETNN